MANETVKGMGFHHIGLSARDFNKSLAFYTALGMKCVSRWGGDENPAAMLDLGDGGRIELFGNGNDKSAENAKWVHFAIKVDDVDAAYNLALCAGAKSQSAPREVPLHAVEGERAVYIAFVIGPDGEVIEFFRQVK